MLLAGLELLTPLQEGPEGGVGLLVDDTLIPLHPYLQADQGHADVQGPVKLHYPKFPFQKLTKWSHNLWFTSTNGLSEIIGLDAVMVNIQRRQSVYQQNLVYN